MSTIKSNIDKMIVNFAVRGLKICVGPLYLSGVNIGNELYTVNHLPPELFNLDKLSSTNRLKIISSPHTHAHKRLIVEAFSSNFDIWAVSHSAYLTPLNVVNEKQFSIRFFDATDAKYMDEMTQWLQTDEFSADMGEFFSAERMSKYTKSSSICYADVYHDAVVRADSATVEKLALYDTSLDKLQVKVDKVDVVGVVGMHVYHAQFIKCFIGSFMKSHMEHFHLFSGWAHDCNLAEMLVILLQKCIDVSVWGHFGIELII